MSLAAEQLDIIALNMKKFKEANFLYSDFRLMSIVKQIFYKKSLQKNINFINPRFISRFAHSCAD